MAITTKYSTPYPYTNGTGPMTDIGSIFTENTTQVIAGNGLIGGGNLSTSRTINVVGGACIAVDADSVKHSTPVAGAAASRTAQANQTLSELSFDTFGHTTKASWATRSLDSWGTTISALTISNNLLVNGNTTLKLNLDVDGDTTLNNLSIDGIVTSNIVISNPAQADPHLTIGSSYNWSPSDDDDSPYVHFNGTRDFYVGSDFEAGFYIDSRASGFREDARLNIDTSGNTVFNDDLQQEVFKLNRYGNNSQVTGSAGPMVFTIKNTENNASNTDESTQLVLSDHEDKGFYFINYPNSGLFLRNYETDEIAMSWSESGIVQIRNNGDVKLETTTEGVHVRGNVSVNSSAPVDANDLTRKDYVDNLVGDYQIRAGSVFVNNDSGVTVTFSPAFPNSCIAVSASIQENTNNDRNMSKGIVLSRTQCSIRNTASDGGENFTFTWIAIGN